MAMTSAAFLATIALSVSMIAASPTSQPASQPSAGAGAAETLAKEFAGRLQRSRYMERGTARDITIPGWEGFPLKRYTYSIKDKDGTEKSADVVMLNPSAGQIATWIVNALIEVNGSYDPDDGRRVFKHILGQSGGQFPVAGVVYEDILPADGVNEIFCFRDGVTVEIDSVPHRGTAPLTPEQVEASIGGNVKRVFTYARIQSTSPKQWIANGGSPAVLGADSKPTRRWLDEVRKAYQAAWRSSRNELLVAWVKANPK
jgi:hypothetical protein